MDKEKQTEDKHAKRIRTDRRTFLRRYFFPEKRSGLGRREQEKAALAIHRLVLWSTGSVLLVQGLIVIITHI